MSCFDTERASEIFHKLAQSEEDRTVIKKDSDDNNNNSIVSNLQRKMMMNTKKFNSFINMNSHPPTMQRYEAMKLLSKQENSEAYTHCRSFRKKFWFAMKKEKQTNNEKI